MRIKNDSIYKIASLYSPLNARVQCVKIILICSGIRVISIRRVTHLVMLHALKFVNTYS